VAPSVSGTPSASDESGPLLAVLPPALQADEGHSFAAILGDTREQAGLIASDLDQLDGANDGLARVQRLVGRLRDVAVVALDTNSCRPSGRYCSGRWT